MPTDEPLPVHPPASASDPPRAEDHQGLVVVIALGYVGCGIELEDLVQEGVLGLIKACRRFDRTRNMKFSTYGKFWIKEAIMHAIHEQARPVRVPITLRRQVSRGVDPEGPGLTPTQRDNLKAALIAIRGECSSKTGDLVVAADPAPEEDDLDYSFVEDVVPCLIFLTGREQVILFEHFGLDGSPPVPFRQIAAALGLSTQRVVQLCNHALRTLRRAIIAKSGDRS